MNKLLNFKHAGLAGIIALLMFSYACTDDFSSINTNPNEPSEAATPFLLTNAQKSLADNYWGEFELGYFGALYAQHWSQNQYTDESRYQIREGVVNSIWEDYYTTLNDLQQIIKQNRENPSETSGFGDPANQIAVAKILKAWTFQTLTDTWGAIPFEEALQGAENPSPAYSTQEEVYTGILELLTEASDSINVSADGFRSGDVFYNGDMAKWKKFANSLKMRAAMRISDVKPGQAQTAIQEALNAGVMTSNADNALFTYNSSVPNNNPINEAYKDRDDFAVSEPLIDLMSSKNDPRMSAYASTTQGGTTNNYIGFPYGLEGGSTGSIRNSGDWSRPSDRVREATFPAIFMLYDEVEFIRAEAAELGFIPGGSAAAAASYQDAITASMEFWGVDDQTAITNYIANNPYSYPQEFGEQKWTAMYLQGIQAWSEWRRLDFTGVLVPPADGKAGVSFPTDIAIRYPYPSDESNLNSENLEEAISEQGFSGDNQGQRLWWDAN